MARWSGVLLAAVLALAAPRAEAALSGQAYYDAAAWLAVLPTPATLESFPSYSMVASDGFGAKPAVAVSSGSWGGSFQCLDAFAICTGTNSITYTLPFEIIGLAGQLDYRMPMFVGAFPLDAFYPPLETGILPNEPGGLSGLYRYDSFFGVLFAAPTNTLTVALRFENLDTGGPSDMVSFLLTNARVVTVPEPSALALLSLGLLGMTLAARRRT
ncbi:PEP-CTERM sorting domain-containing protein [Siccirubricoccus sp. G192]|uniref:PEP-CTERM sorting domain-containing protein n=1 Tax=Siccirubricoccus sp. G192 TaxID=2849651 RepID=UPI001C2BE301|nr:PEP-CTERM sorting domain-containing protein [Siccirubricoccus sp. G192]MBV1799800.1 PEP-CTERM sorting domain-containing protein [Siccirubricoccus sp. G192]